MTEDLKRRFDSASEVACRTADLLSNHNEATPAWVARICFDGLAEILREFAKDTGCACGENEFGTKWPAGHSKNLCVWAEG